MTIKKILALVLSATVVASAAMIPSFKSTAVTKDGDDWGMDADGIIQDSGITNYDWTSNTVSTDMWMFNGLATYDSIVADKLKKTITFKNFKSTALNTSGYSPELYPGNGSDGYTYIFDGENELYAISIDDAVTNISLSLTPGSVLTVRGWYSAMKPRVTLSDGTTADPSSMPNGAVIFTGEDEEMEDEDADEDEEVFVLTQEMIDEILKYFSALEYQNRLNGFENNLLQAAYNATPASPQVLYFSEGDALPLEVFGILKTNPNVSIVFHYTYKGQTYQLWISGAQAAKYYNENIKWYGPELLASMFPADTSGLFNFN